MSHGLEGSITLELDGVEEMLPLKDFYHIDGGTNGNNYIFHNDEHGLDLNLEINNGNVNVVSATHQGIEVEEFEQDS
ncbi:hypothetical protein [Vreelandella titanicae]|uniref:hypothetical protein n=1 Tax=Vreelandella titanicae TaxID=664683 RepID=UPI001F4076EA|nr:hypothetical protein [Halomonas titanicae]MCE7521357.1 hypothetical protein [Halomonas titanicae]